MNIDWHEHDALEVDKYGRSNWHFHDGRPSHQHDLISEQITFHYIVKKPHNQQPRSNHSHEHQP